MENKKFTTPEGKIFLFPNQWKEKDNHPDLKGECNIDGILYNISLWTNEKNGRSYLSGYVKKAEKKEDDLNGLSIDVIKKMAQTKQDIEEEELPF